MAVRRVNRGDPIRTAWDAGELPPVEAFDPEKRDDVIECIYFRWADVPTYRSDHPHLREWLAALRGDRA